MADVSGPESGEQPLLRVINADATAEEVAALLAVFSALGSSTGAGAPKRPRPSWNNPARGVRRTHRHGDGAWRASGLPS